MILEELFKKRGIFLYYRVIIIENRVVFHKKALQEISHKYACTIWKNYSVYFSISFAQIQHILTHPN